mmetsp:Transcript_11223/g.19586  ORF Transcript_11223/g.19586 Transcript_11223/m.19586 type:complete len:175 (-) Transcript_11223:97-621(-)
MWSSCAMAWLCRPLTRRMQAGAAQLSNAVQASLSVPSASAASSSSSPLIAAGVHTQVRCFGGPKRDGGPVLKSTFAPWPMVPYGVKRSAAYRESKKAARKAAERARRAQEEKGMILDPKKQLRMELKRNSGIGWYRASQITKHLEMHERGKGPPMDQAMRDRITDIARVVRMGK